MKGAMHGVEETETGMDVIVEWRLDGRSDEWEMF